MKSYIGITGCSGSLGKTLLKIGKKKKFVCFSGDVRNRDHVLKWITKNNLKAVIHLAAIVPIKDVNNNKKKAKDVNFLGTKNIVIAVKKSKVDWLFFSSTSHVYKSSYEKISERSKKNPVSYYGRTKLLAENYIIDQLDKTNKRYCIGRIFSTSNKDQKKNYLVPDLKKRIKKTKKKIMFKNLNHYRDFISMQEISRIILKLYKKRYKGIINIGSGQSIHLKDIAKTICRKYKKEFHFKDNKNPSYLIADNSKLKKLFKLNKKINLRKLIF